MLNLKKKKIDISKLDKINIVQRLGKTYQIGHGYFLNIKKISPNSRKQLKTRAETLFNNYLKGTIKEYIVQNHGDGPETDEILEGIKNAFLGPLQKS